MIRKLYTDVPDPAETQKNCNPLKQSKTQVKNCKQNQIPKIHTKIFNTLTLKSAGNKTSNPCSQFSIVTRNLKETSLWATEKTSKIPGKMEQIIIK